MKWDWTMNFEAYNRKSFCMDGWTLLSFSALIFMFPYKASKMNSSYFLTKYLCTPNMLISFFSGSGILLTMTSWHQINHNKLPLAQVVQFIARWSVSGCVSFLFWCSRWKKSNQKKRLFKNTLTLTRMLRFLDICSLNIF